MSTVVCSEEYTGTINIDLTPDSETNLMEIRTKSVDFKPMNIQIIKINDNKKVYWNRTITVQQDINISIPIGTYKVLINEKGKCATWVYDNNGAGYTVSQQETTFIPLSENTIGLDVIADVPWRFEPNINIPLFLMVKGADQNNYPVYSIEIYDDKMPYGSSLLNEDVLIKTINLAGSGDCFGQSYLNIDHDWYYGEDTNLIPELNPNDFTKDSDGIIHLHIKYDAATICDPLSTDAEIYTSTSSSEYYLPALPNWFAGDVHYHSVYTDNLVEFGYPIEATVAAGKAIGIDWVTVTDHSFDFDSHMSSFDETWKWSQFEDDCKDLSEDGYSDSEFKCVRAEEISATNSEGKFIHYLAYGINSAIEGEGADGLWYTGNEDNTDTNGDGLDDAPQTFSLVDVITYVNNQNAFGYAAHPVSHPLHDILVERDNWQPEDYARDGYKGLEVWNTINSDSDRDTGIDIWKELLLEGRKLYISGGSDAHGDFSHANNILGTTANAFAKVRTLVFTEDFSNNGILNALKKGHSIMTDGPVVVFDITNETGNKAIIGDEITGNQLSMNIEWKSTPEFGNIDHIYIHRGIIGEEETELTELSLSPDNLEGTASFNINSYLPLEKESYIRINATTDKGYRAYTNPIWVYKNAPEDEFGYTFKDSNTLNGPAYDWIEISGTGKEVLPDNDDGWVGSIDLGFFFNYYGTDYSQLAISNNGLIFSGGTTWEYVNEPIKQSPSVHGFITPFWDDIVTFNPKGAIYYQTFGTAPNRMFVVEWYENNHYWDSDSGVTFEAILYEGSNNIKFQYKDVDFGNVYWAVDGDNPPYNNGGSATVGIECPAGDDGLQYSFNAPVIDPGLAILFKFPQFAGTNLYLSKQAPASKDPGSTMTYTLHYHNFGDTAAQNVVLEDTLPAEVEFVSASDGGSYDPDTGKITWNIGSVEKEGHGYVTTTVSILQDAAIGTMIQNDAIISTSNLEVRYDDNEAHAQTEITDSNLPPDVSVEPNNGGIGTPSVNWHDPVTFSYHSCDSATGVDIRIHVNDGEPDIPGSMAGGPSDWTYTTTFYPRHGRAQVTYTVYGCNEETVSFDIYIDPAGYIYNAETGERIAGATVWLQWPDGEGGWVHVPTDENPAIMQPDVNPLITGEDGEYQWDVLEGSYRVHVEADGYYPADSIVVSIPPAVTDLHVGLTGLPDETPPVITNVGAVPDANSAVITWETDEASDSLVMCGISSGDYPINDSDSAMVVSHSITLIGLDPDTPYCYVVCSTDSQDNSAESAEFSFRTLSETTPTPESIPEFPTIALPVLTVIGLMFMFGRKRYMF